MPPRESTMTVADRLGRWRDEGAITPEQHDAIGAIVGGRSGGAGGGTDF